MSSIGWESWNDEIIQLYVTEDKSAEETIRTLNERHKLRITIKQFKKRYSGMKKVGGNEWRAFKREIEKQKAAGKECLIFLNGRQLSPERVVREMHRYSGIRGRDVEDGGVPLGDQAGSVHSLLLKLRTKQISDSDVSVDIASSVLRFDSPEDVTRIANSSGQNSTNVNSHSAEMYFSEFSWSNVSMRTPRFTELLFQNNIPDTLPVQAWTISRTRICSGRGGVDGTNESTTSAISQRSCPTPEYSIPAFGLSNSRIHAIPSFLQWATGMNVWDQLAVYLKTNPGDSEALLEAAVRRLRLKRFEDDHSGPSGSNYKAPWWEQLVDFFDNKGLGFSNEVSSLLLHVVAATSSVSSARVLLAHGADIKLTAAIRCGRSGRHPVTPIGPPLFQALFNHRSHMAEFLIKAGSKIDHCYKTGDTGVFYNAFGISISELELKIADILLKGAQIPPLTRVDSRDLRNLLETPLNRRQFPLLRRWVLCQTPLVDLIVEAANFGGTELSKILLRHNILQESALECVLRRATKTNSTLAVQTLLQHGVDPNPPPCQIECLKVLGVGEGLVGLAPIHFPDSTSNAGKNIICLLLQAGSTVPNDILINILEQGESEDLPLICSVLGPDVSTAPGIGSSALEHAASKRSLVLCNYLLALKVSLNCYGACGMTCLQRAAGQSDLLLTRFFLEHGADVNFAAHEDGGRTALQSNIEVGADSLVECLLSAGADIKVAPAKRNAVTVLEAFAKHSTARSTADPTGEFRIEKLERFRKWVAIGVPVNRSNGDHSRLLHHLALRLPLQLAADLDGVEAARLLPNHGADINALPSDEYGRTALQAATCNFGGQCGHEMPKLLLYFEPDINAPPAREGGITALQGVAISDDLSAAEILMDRGADVNVPAAAENGRTAVEGAAEHGRISMVRFLLKNGAKETGFTTAIELAEAEVYLGVAKFLREHVAMSALLDLELAHGASNDLSTTLPSPGFVFTDEIMADFNF
ncbi:hypothetical protein CSAL01_05172 [Colletotrichum salicis]|uniref:Clr5 domain-containing protein n=1 Tax=Colletotrichum salicis TaxID=1209931 RepID=A0A135V7K2_9PEZI|nr:hypothetical protein CSAL01_05172 [Colletotrichum salicis]